MKNIYVVIKRFDKTLPLPEYKTDGSIGFDLVCRQETVIRPFEVKLIPLNVVIKIPKGYGLFLIPRSSTPLKKNLLIPNGVGVIDQDYCGENDEIKLPVLNFSKKDVTVTKGERIAQAVFVKLEKFNFSEIDSMKEKSRGGFGSTG
ncbi:MAG: dUTPase [Candidatus Levybacteria bacterium RIFCSPHIGHO2_01_FULL_36_15]|nr:MAG: dUTPase [Candidatus Levybacteria bacterium RIFCSPHIGHO2_01_FULL_36_15]